MSASVKVTHINTPEGRTIEHEKFMAMWESTIQTMDAEELDHWFHQCSTNGGPFHPKENMRWLYDRLLLAKAVL